MLAAWSGIRPLIVDPKAKDTQSITRSHFIEVSSSGMVTIAGGKWTTYRAMAEDTINETIKVGKFDQAGESGTLGLKLVGGKHYYPTLFIQLIQDYGLDEDVSTRAFTCSWQPVLFICNTRITSTVLKENKIIRIYIDKSKYPKKAINAKHSLQYFVIKLCHFHLLKMSLVNIFKHRLPGTWPTAMATKLLR